MRDSILQLEKNSRNLKKKNLIYLIYVFPLSTLGILLIDVLPQTIGQFDYYCVNNIQLEVVNKAGEVAFFLRDLIFLLSCSLVGYFFFFLPILKSKPRRGVFSFFTPLLILNLLSRLLVFLYKVRNICTKILQQTLGELMIS